MSVTLHPHKSRAQLYFEEGRTDWRPLPGVVPYAGAVTPDRVRDWLISYAPDGIVGVMVNPRGCVIARYLCETFPGYSFVVGLSGATMDMGRASKTIRWGDWTVDYIKLLFAGNYYRPVTAGHALKTLNRLFPPAPSSPAEPSLPGPDPTPAWRDLSRPPTRVDVSKCLWTTILCLCVVTTFVAVAAHVLS